MATELSYVIITPYTIYKSRTGGVIARLLTRSSLEIAGAMMFAPSQELADEFISTFPETPDSPDNNKDQEIQKMIHDYVVNYFAPDPVSKKRQRCMVLLFRGEDAIRRTREAVGHISHQSSGGETVRDTYSDIVFNRDGSLRYFEPAAIVAPNIENAKKNLKIWAKYAESDGGVLDNIAPSCKDANHQRTLVIIKPDNFRFPSGRPGNLIDMLSKSKLCITGMKAHRMSVAEAEEFYGPVLPVLQDKLGEPFAVQVADLVKEKLALDIPDVDRDKLAKVLGPLAGRKKFNKIIKFMTGRTPQDCTPQTHSAPGTEKSIVLIYEGIDAVKKIRTVLGPTDPSKAPPGSIRREFGKDIMVNAAHASDSPDNAVREMGIVRIKENNFKTLIQEYYGE